jgi:hypothetical protein
MIGWALASPCRVSWAILLFVVSIGLGCYALWETE